MFKELADFFAFPQPAIFQKRRIATFSLYYTTVPAKQIPTYVYDSLLIYIFVTSLFHQVSRTDNALTTSKRHLCTQQTMRI